ncbi:hypothetical protein ACJX0J_042123, partial [Zea mays]
MEDDSAVVPWFVDIPVRLHTSRRDLDGLGLNADYCRERLQDGAFQIDRLESLLTEVGFFRSVYLITLDMLIALLMGLNMSWTTITAALFLLALDFMDAQACLEKVSYSLLIFFCGMFITVDGSNKTSIPNTLWELVEPYSRIDSAKGVALLVVVILILSNVASNVPT